MVLIKKLKVIWVFCELALGAGQSMMNKSCKLLI